MPNPIGKHDFMDGDLWALATALRTIAEEQTSALAAALELHVAPLSENHEAEHDELVGSLSELGAALKELTQTLDKGFARLTDTIYDLSRR